MDTIVMPAPRYKAIVDRLASDIRSAALPPGSQLPTHRQLADQEKIALVTASRVYSELEAMGLVSGETGRGTFVRNSALPLGNGIDQTEVLTDLLDLNFNSATLPGQSDLLRQSLRQLSQRGDLESLLHYQPHAGRRHERASIARHLKQRGLNANPDNLLIVSGAQHGLAVTVMSQLNPGDVVAVDSLTYPGFKTVAELYRIELVAIPSSAQGPDLAALETLCLQRKIRALYCMPTLQNPLGWVLSLAQRQQLIGIARAHQLLLIEDAAYAFLIENPPPPLAELAPDITIYVSGLSKNIATGLRLGFVLAPADCFASIERAIRATTWNTPSLITTLSCQWLDDGTVETLERDKREDAYTRQQIARRVFSTMATISHCYSYFIWLPLPLEVRAETIASNLLEAGISVSTAAPFSTAAVVPHALRLALGSIPLTALAQTLNQVKHQIENYRY